MYNSNKAIIFGGVFLVFIFFFTNIKSLPTVFHQKTNNVPTYLVSYKNRIWWTSQNGELLCTAKSADVLKKVVVSGVDVEELFVKKDSFEIINLLKDILDDPYIAEIRIKQKCAILLKGVILYFSDWNDLVNHVSSLKDLIPIMQPKTEYYLTSAGLVYKIRGGGGEEE
ncbi:MAG: DUF4894 domain-containing protein [Pseudothermotoga sp.]